jgi:hypothetical protein
MLASNLVKGRHIAVAVALVLALSPFLQWQSAYAHTFSEDETVHFLSLVNKIRVESQLAADNASESELASYHAQIAAESLDDHTVEEIAERNERIARDLPAALEDLQAASTQSPDDIGGLVSTIDSLLSEAVTVRIDSEQLTNSTTQAVVLAEAIDETLSSYGTAIGSEMDLTDMSLMAEMEDSESDDHGSSGHGSSDVEIVDAGAYQSAQAFAQKSIDIFQNDLKPLGPAEPDGEAAVAEIEDALLELQAAVSDRAAPEEVMHIVHASVHPNMLLAYNLQVIPEFPLPLLLIVPAIASIIVVTRLRPAWFR